MSDKNGPYTVGQKPAAYTERQAVRAGYDTTAAVIPQHEMDVYSRNQIGRAKILPDGRWELRLTAGGDPLVYSDEEFRSIYARSNPSLLSPEKTRDAVAILHDRYGVPSEAVRAEVSADDACDCASKTPTYPVFRSNPHLPGCPQFRPEET